MNTPSLSELAQQANQCFDRGDYQQAIARAEELAAQARVSQNSKDELWALSHITASWANLGNYPKMAEIATQLLVRARYLLNEKSEILAVLRLATALAHIDVRGRWQEIRPLLLEGLGTTRQLGDSFLQVYYLMRLGAFAARVGEETHALDWLQEALNTISSDIQNQHWMQGEIYMALSMLMGQRGNLVEAVGYAELALGEMRVDNKADCISDAQLCLAEAEQARGERGEALRLVTEVLEQAQRYGWRGHQQKAYYLQGELERELGHTEQAEEAARKGLGMAQQMKMKEEEVKCLLSLGQALQALQRRDEACTVLRQAQRLSQEREYADHFAKAEELLVNC